MKRHRGGWSRVVALVERPAPRELTLRIPGPGNRGVRILVPSELPAGAELAPTEAGRRILERLPEGEPAHLVAVEHALVVYAAALDERRAEAEAAEDARTDRLRAKARRAVAVAARRVAKLGRGRRKAGDRTPLVEAVATLRAAWLELDRAGMDELSERHTATTQTGDPWEVLERALLIGTDAELVAVAESIAKAASPPAGRPGNDLETLVYVLFARVWIDSTGELPTAPGGDRRLSEDRNTAAERLSGYSREEMIGRRPSAFEAFLLAAVREIAPKAAVNLRSLDAATKAMRRGRRAPRGQRQPLSPDRTAQHAEAQQTQANPPEPNLLERAIETLTENGGAMSSRDLCARLGVSTEADRLDLLIELVDSEHCLTSPDSTGAGVIVILPDR